MGNNRELEFTIYKMEKRNMENGKMAQRKDG